MTAISLVVHVPLSVREKSILIAPEIQRVTAIPQTHRVCEQRSYPW